MSMTESEALDMLRAKLTCMELEDLACIEKGCDKDCDNCNYCYEQGNRGQSKKALSVAITALEEIQQYRAIGTIPKLQDKMNFLDFLCNAIMPNEMEQYLAMYHASELKGE